MRPAGAEDLPGLERIRQTAFAPVFASFRAALGDEPYALVQAREDRAQGALLASHMARGSAWEVFAAKGRRGTSPVLSPCS